MATAPPAGLSREAMIALLMARAKEQQLQERKEAVTGAAPSDPAVIAVSDVRPPLPRPVSNDTRSAAVGSYPSVSPIEASHNGTATSSTSPTVAPVSIYPVLLASPAAAPSTPPTEKGAPPLPKRPSLPVVGAPLPPVPPHPSTSSQPQPTPPTVRRPTPEPPRRPSNAEPSTVSVSHTAETSIDRSVSRSSSRSSFRRVRSSSVSGVEPLPAHCSDLFAPHFQLSAAPPLLDESELPSKPASPPAQARRWTAGELAAEMERVRRDPFATEVERLVVLGPAHGSAPQSANDSITAVLLHPELQASLRGVNPLVIDWMIEPKRLKQLLYTICRPLPRVSGEMSAEQAEAARQRARRIRFVIGTMLRELSEQSAFRDEMFRAHSAKSSRMYPGFDTFMAYYLSHYGQLSLPVVDEAIKAAARVQERLQQQLSGGGESEQLPFTSLPASDALIFADCVLTQWAGSQWDVLAAYLTLGSNTMLLDCLVTLSYNAGVQRLVSALVSEAATRKEAQRLTGTAQTQAVLMLSVSLSAAFHTLGWFHKLRHSKRHKDETLRAAELQVCTLLRSLLQAAQAWSGLRWWSEPQAYQAITDLQRTTAAHVSACMRALNLPSDGSGRSLSQRVDELVSTLQLWPLLLLAVKKAAADAPKDVVVAGLVQKLESSLEAAFLVPTIRLLLTVQKADDSDCAGNAPPSSPEVRAGRTRISVCVAQCWEVLAVQASEPTMECLVAHGGLPVAVSAYVQVSRVGGSGCVASKAWSFFFATLLTSSAALELGAAQLLGTAGLWTELLTSLSLRPSHIQQLRLVALSLLSPSSMVQAVLDANPAWAQWKRDPELLGWLERSVASHVDFRCDWLPDGETACDRLEERLG